MSIQDIVHISKFIENDEKLFNSVLQTQSWDKVNYFKRHVCHYDFSDFLLNQTIESIQSYFSRNVVAGFLNLYTDGEEYAPYHADKYGKDTILISLGTQRILRYKHNQSGNNSDYNLESGDILYVPDKINLDYKHSLLKRTKIKEARISILLFLENEK